MRFEYEFSFIFPVHNEEEILGKQLNIFINFLKKRKIRNYEIILIENGSIDNSLRIISDLARKNRKIKFYHLETASYGLAIKNGLLLARGTYLLLLDIDFFSLNFLNKGLKDVVKYPLIVASKSLVKGCDKRPFRHKIRTRFFQLINRYFLKYPGTDTHGHKIIKNSLLLKKTIYSCFTKYEFFDTELLLRLVKTKKYRLKEVSVITGEIRSSRYFLLRRYYLCLLDLIRIISSYIFRDKHFGEKAIALFKINADDYGANENVDQIILDQQTASSINRISILANLIDKKSLDNLKKLNKTSNFDLNLHFNLLRGKPISSITSVPTLVNKDGKFFSLIIFMIKMLFKKIDLQEVKQELNQQFDHLKKNKIYCSGIDSEQHLHIFYPIWPIVVEFARKNNLKIRSQKSTFYHLKKHPIKFLFCYFAQLFFLVNFSKKYNFKAIQTHDSIIVHPGLNYD
jgi:predicted glycoside hydrolase/deacetylase ChbG (UPF0249 family)